MTTDYPDLDGNGVPDAFEQRLPISEILNLPQEESAPPPPITTLVIEIEIGQRPPRKGELYFIGGVVHRCGYDSSVAMTIVSRVISAPVDWRPIQR